MYTQAQVHVKVQEPPAPEAALEVPTQRKLERRVEDAEKLGEMGMLPRSSPTQQLAQMAAEAGTSMSGSEEPVRRKL